MRQRQTLLRKMLTCGLLATALTLTSMQARAQDVTVRGSGTCQAFLDAERNSLPEAVKQLTWLLGYVSGLAVATEVDILGNHDPDSMLTWVNLYCQRYPAKYLSNAGNMYYQFRKDQMKASVK